MPYGLQQKARQTEEEGIMRLLILFFRKDKMVYKPELNISKIPESERKDEER